MLDKCNAQNGEVVFGQFEWPAPWLFDAEGWDVWAWPGSSVTVGSRHSLISRQLVF